MTLKLTSEARERCDEAKREARLFAAAIAAKTTRKEIFAWARSKEVRFTEAQKKLKKVDLIALIERHYAIEDAFYAIPANVRVFD